MHYEYRRSTAWLDQESRKIPANFPKNREIRLRKSGDWFAHDSLHRQ
jgi:hypothetical protein